MSDLVEDMDFLADREPELLVPTDEPEPVTEAEAQTADIPLPAREPEEPHIAHLVCEVCLELNLTTKSVIRCGKCEQAFCYHFGSAIDPQFCINCMSDMSVTKSTITKSYESINPETGEKSFYRRRAREIKIDGLSWQFAQRRIIELADVELDMTIEYHRNICSLLIDESERRRNEKIHRYANVKMVIPTPATTNVKDSTTTTTKKSRTVSKTKAQEGVAAILQSMLAKGMSMQDIMVALATKK
ncbi:MAG: hypothetical protein P4L77_12115 [Sulfuriferula sp.]|nr:hypothetical protein [Sulfuriferula sp.]